MSSKIKINKPIATETNVSRSQNKFKSIEPQNDDNKNLSNSRSNSTYSLYGIEGQMYMNKSSSNQTLVPIKPNLKTIKDNFLKLNGKT